MVCMYNFHVVATQGLNLMYLHIRLSHLQAMDTL